MRFASQHMMPEVALSHLWLLHVLLTEISGKVAEQERGRTSGSSWRRIVPTQNPLHHGETSLQWQDSPGSLLTVSAEQAGQMKVADFKG